ncbi:MAG: hypothetical protein II205_01315, partial [Bacteroidales bacterium]|nr:hypothetical protein [Bacteroidales bacterium]
MTEEEQKEFDNLSTIYRGSELHRSSRLKDYVDSPSLFEAYPELRNIEVELVDGGDGNYSPSANKIKIGRRGDVESVLAHEIQHAIQSIEGFAQGSSASYWARRDGTDTYMLPTSEYERMQNNLRIANQLPENITEREVRDLWRNATNNNDRLAYVEIMDGLSQGYPLSEVKDMFQRDLDEAREILENDFRDNESPYNKYLRTAGEVEARNVQRRLEMSLEQRRKSLAAETEDVAREDQIILREGLAAEGGVSFQIGDNAATEALNAKQQKNGSQEVVEESEILFRISNNNRQTITGWLNKREDLTEEDKQSFLNYIEDFPAKNQLVYSKWFANGAIRLPEDAPKVEQAIKVATIAKVDPMRYRNPMEIIDAFADIEVKGKRINPDTVSTLSDKQVVGDTGIVTYLVEESEESRKNMREIINTHFGKDCSPWCLLQGDGDGKLTEKSADYWKHYSAYPKRVAFKNGKLLAFSANSNNRVLWWDKQDASHDGIPVIGKLSNDELGRSGVIE